MCLSFERSKERYTQYSTGKALKFNRKLSCMRTKDIHVYPYSLDGFLGPSNSSLQPYSVVYNHTWARSGGLGGGKATKLGGGAPGKGLGGGVKNIFSKGLNLGLK